MLHHTEVISSGILSKPSVLYDLLQTMSIKNKCIFLLTHEVSVHLYRSTKPYGCLYAICWSVCVYSLNVCTTPEILRPLGDTIGIYTSLLKQNTWTTWHFWFPQWSLLRTQSTNMWHSIVWEGMLGTRYCHLLLHTEAARTLFFLILVPTYQNMWCDIPEQCNHDSCQSSITGHHESFAHTQIHTAHHTVTSRSTRGNNLYDKTIFTPFFSYKKTLL
jgi:hypothetical protein